ncbi:dnaJ homolog subfamily C member 13-like [Lingula anatina]|uniref:DnaJ homolog subfamily C member 13-like n=1 Tax=Lingula anatina TaxID=7574 RepID=A0A2R2MTA1_LINAN|nr:dnaJ homolog subfamily C member 13-like [Lingula anatina]|eukprot:XP_023933252.1 dnaJ homolog subfamily C member 13-like [Lingula anatina]
MATKTNAAMKENEDIACYFVTKHSWKGKYKRVFSVGNLGITTYNPATLEVTNQWPYSEFISITPNIKAPTLNEFLITMKKGPKKTDTMKFSTDHRADVLTEALRFANQFAGKDFQSKRFNAYKYHWSDNRIPTLLQVNQSSLDQVDPKTGTKLVSYDYKDMEGFAVISDYPGGVAVIHGGYNRLHIFALEQRDELIKSVMETAANYIGIAIKQRKEPITMDQATAHKMGKYSTDEALTSYAEFSVYKLTPRNPDPIRRTLCLTETCLVERDPATYNVVTAKPLCDVFAIVRDQENPQKFSVEYVKGAIRTFTSTDRDALIASVLDGVRASGNRDVHVKMKFTSRGLRLGPFTVPVDEEVESQHMKFIQSPPPNINFEMAVERFNSNISYSGLLHAVTQDGLFAENKEKLINGTLSALLDKEGDQAIISSENLEAQFHALRRLVASKAGFQAFTRLPKMRERVGIKVVKALKRNDDGVAHAAIDMLNALMQPMHDDYDLRQEQLNKASLMSSKSFMQNLLNLFKNHVLRGTGAMVIAAMLDFLTFGLCAPYSETTDGTYFDTLLEMVATEGRTIFKLFQHPSMAIVKGAGLVMKAVIEEGEPEVAAKMQDLALGEGALPRHLLTAMFTQSMDSRMLTNRQLSRHLVALWVTGHPTAMGLLKRIMPSGLLVYLDSTDEVPEHEEDKLHVRDNVKLAQEHQSRGRKFTNPQWKLVEKKVETILLHWRAKIGMQKKDTGEKPIVLRKRRQRIKSEANWELFHYMFNRDHAKSNLIWNFKTREELKEALENEIRAFNVDKDLSSSFMIAWNHQEFEVPYHCLAEEIKIGDYYLRLLLEEDENEDTSAIKRSYEFFNDLYHRFLLTPKIHMKCMCLQAMSIVYSKCHEEIGTFNDTKYIVGMLERCADKLERDRLVQFLQKLILNKRNVKELMDAGGIKVLVDLLTLAHLHTTRATVPLQSNVLEAAPDMKRDSEKEWYYGNKDKERLGPFSFEEMKDLYKEGVLHAKTRCWAQGMDGWRPLSSVPQLKWCLLATGQAVMNESDLAIAILNMLIKISEFYPSRDPDGAIIRPLPRCKRLLSDATCLSHLVQLLLTFDPIIVEKVAVLLYLIMQDNPNLSRLYLTGAFYFIMMYTGSNVLPVVKFLKYTHLKQAFRSDENITSDIVSRSVLGHIMPEAMICYLENYESEKFAEIFLGEFDTPEAIWCNEMRRLMIEKIAAHLADFSPRLQSNTRALYQYCPIPIIDYPQLENELFCNIYYLKHLCDTVRFPDWPIKEPVKLLKDILDAWKREVEKKPPSMSIEEALETLKLPKDPEGTDEGKIRKAYFRLAQKYHPDKNPEGRDMFEKVNKAYEFLCSKTKITEGPDPDNIVLILRAQSILFSRHKDVLEPYKYAGYPMLIKTIKMETQDDTLFSKSVPLLEASSELAFHTVNCSALNAEELRRESGIETLQEAFSRCVGVLSSSTKPEELAVKVCIHIARCYAVASQFEGCREKIQENPTIVKDLCRILYFKNLPYLNTVVVNCVSAFCVDFYLQNHLFKSGCMWHLLLFLFNYDYTLEEGGVERSGESNQQEVANSLAKISICALSRLGGYTLGDESTPENPVVKKSLAALLTPYMSRKLANDNPAETWDIEVLKILNSNTENPYLIWDNATRAELNEFVSDQQQLVIRHGDCDPDFGSTFVYTIHSKELIVGEIFVRVYNEQPTFPLEKPKTFTIDLLDFLGSQAQYLHSLMSLQQAEICANKQGERLKQVEQALEALRNVIKNNPGVEIQCIGHFKLLFALLRLHGCGTVQQFALEVLNSVTTNKECVNDISASEVLAYLLIVIQTLPKCHTLILETLYALMSNTQIVKEAMQKGALIYLLDLFCNSTNPAVREQTAELFGKMLADKLVGPKVRIILAKFLPSIFMDAMRDSAEASVHMFEGTHENPELIWNDDARDRVCRTVKEMKKEFYSEQKDNPTAKWKLPQEFDVTGSDVEGEVVVAGVYLRLFVANPAWVLRKPKEFLTELLEKWGQLCGSQSPNGDMLEMVTSALVLFCQAQTAMVDQVPQLGHIPKIFQYMSSKNTAIPFSAVQIVRQLAESDICIRAMAQVECIGPMKIAMKIRKDAVGTACEALNKMFSLGEDELVQQALKTEMVQFLLRFLETGLENAENPAAIKAQIVKALKAMQNSLAHGEAVTTILSESSVWKEYKDQKHDLFISDNKVAGYLTGPGVAGYLTAGTSSNMPSAPPPVFPQDH